MTFTFDATLYRPDGPGMMTVLPIPASVASEAGFRSRQRVKGRINGLPIATSLQSSGVGWLAFVVSKKQLERLGLSPGDGVRVEIERDEGPVVVAVPGAFLVALRAEPRARAFFE